MPRYEQGSRFWDITLKGKEFTTTFGKIGSAGQTRLKKFKDVVAARTMYNLAVDQKVGDGFELTNNYLTGAGIALLKGVAKKVDARKQREADDPEYRHPAVCE